MKLLFRNWLILPFWVFLASAPAVGAQTEEPILIPIADRPLAPDFVLPGADGQSVRLADYRGKPLILNFWATWCPPCRAEMPALQRAHALLAPEGIAVVAINVGDDPDAIAEFLADSPLNLPLPMDRDTTLAQRYPLIGLPTTFIVDPAGRLVFSATGEQEWDAPALLDQIRALKH